MKDYRVEYKIGGTGYITIKANSAEEAEDELWNIFDEEPLIHEDENGWIDKEDLWDIEWTEIDVVHAYKER